MGVDQLTGDAGGDAGVDADLHQTEITTAITVEAGEGTVLPGPVTGTGSISGDGRLFVV